MEWYYWALVIIVLLLVVSWLRMQYEVPQKTKGKIIALYYRDGCPPCDAMKADWRKFVDKKFVTTLSTETSTHSKEDLEKNKITGTPTVIVSQDGVEVYRKAGSHTYSDLVKLLQI